MAAQELRGVIVPLMTPFQANGEVDQAMLRQLVEYELAAGVHGLFALGTFGHGPAMSAEERMATAEVILDQVRGRVPVILHCGAADLPTTIRLAKHAEQAGADVIALITPYYFEHSEDEWMAHFEAVAEVTHLPLFLYNNKTNSGIDVTPAQARKLVERIPRFIGQKLAFSTLDNMMQHVRALPHGFATFAGTSTLLLPGVPFGVAGIVNPQSSLFPKLTVDLWDAVTSKDWNRAMELQAKVLDVALTVTKLYKSYGRGIDCEVMRMHGFDVQMFPRWKTKPVDAAVLEQLRAALDRAGVLRAVNV